MTDKLCGDCEFALNERPNLELKRRDFDCIGLPPMTHVQILPNGRNAAMVVRGAVVGGRDKACALFKRRMQQFGGEIALPMKQPEPKEAA